MEPLTQRAQRKVISMDCLPVPSPVLAQVVSLLQDDEAGAKAYDKVLSKDPGIYSLILRVANSAYYGCKGQVADLERAIVVIGLSEVKNICLTVSLSSNFSGSTLSRAFDHKLFWEHSLLVANLAKELAEKARQGASVTSFYTMGLLHDLGRLALAAYLPDYFDRVMGKAAESGTSLYETEMCLGLTHTQMGYWLASRWGFPEDICQVVSCHHTPALAKNSVPDTTLIYLADRMAKYAQDPEGEPVPMPDPVFLETAGISPRQFEGLLDAIFERLKETEALYHLLCGEP